MRLQSYPRPPGDTGIGFHYFPNADHYTRQDMRRWLPELRAMGATWLVLRSEGDLPIPEHFLREFIRDGIEPVVWFSARIVSPQALPELRDLLRTYATYGLHYVCFFAQPNLVRRWPAGEWAKPNLVERFLELLLPCWERALETGLYPLFPPLASGGQYWDTAFLAAALEGLAERGKGALFDRVGIAMQNFAYNLPLDWGKGGAAQWRDSFPYHTPEGCQDHQGFYLFQWYDEIVRAHLGFSLPLIAMANGSPLGTQEDERYPPLDEELHAQRHREMARLLMAGELPDYVFNHAFWLLGAEEGSSEEAEAWFPAEGTPRLAVAALKDLPKHPRRFTWERAPEAHPLPRHKPLHHYLLFPRAQEGLEEADWHMAWSYIRRFQPTVGFRAEEAMQAEYVTIVGGPLGVSPQVERTIRVGGCKVERLSGDSRRETKRLLERLAAEGRRFLGR